MVKVSVTILCSGPLLVSSGFFVELDLDSALPVLCITTVTFELSLVEETPPVNAEAPAVPVVPCVTVIGVKVSITEVFELDAAAVSEASVVIPMVGLKLGPDSAELYPVPRADVVELPVLNGATDMLDKDATIDVSDTDPSEDCFVVLWGSIVVCGSVVGSGGKVVVCTEA